MNDTGARHPPSKAARLFVKRLAELGAHELGTLRRAAGKPLGNDVAAYDIFRDLFHSVRQRYPAEKWAAYFVATLYPWHTQAGGDGNLGGALRRLCMSASRPEDQERADQRFVRLLECRQQESLFTEIASCVRRLSRSDVPVDWPQLLKDLSDWYKPGQPVQHAWADGYFAEQKGKNPCSSKSI